MYLRLHLRFLLGLRPSPLVLPSLLSHPVETMAGPLGSILTFLMSLLAMCQPNILYGGPGGSRTRVQESFTSKELQQFFYAVNTATALL